jgi:hypothetical protein
VEADGFLGNSDVSLSLVTCVNVWPVVAAHAGRIIAGPRTHKLTPTLHHNRTQQYRMKPTGIHTVTDPSPDGRGDTDHAARMITDTIYSEKFALLSEKRRVEIYYPRKFDRFIVGPSMVNRLNKKKKATPISRV